LREFLILYGEKDELTNFLRMKSVRERNEEGEEQELEEEGRQAGRQVQVRMKLINPQGLSQVHLASEHAAGL
jgi:hypothetical protein